MNHRMRRPPRQTDAPRMRNKLMLLRPASAGGMSGQFVHSTETAGRSIAGALSDFTLSQTYAIA